MVFEYTQNIDSTFVLGHVNPPNGELRINGDTVSLAVDGAFLAWLPLRRPPQEPAWDLRYRSPNGDSATANFPYSFRRQETSDSMSGTLFPCVLRVSQPNAHVRTAPGASYYAFPQVETELWSVGYRDGYFLLEIGGGIKGAIESRFVQASANTQIAVEYLGDGRCRKFGEYSECVFPLKRPLLWQSELENGNRELRLALYGAVSAIDRIRYETDDPLISDIQWTQEAFGVEMHIHTKAPLRTGYRVEWMDDSLRIIVRSAAEKHRGLNGKTVVVDPGHGGAATGTIGPLGTMEKDVMLRLSQLVTDRLRKFGASAVLTRTDDRDLGLYDRIEFARHHRADFFLSLHANALPDGENPLQRHGSSTYYYQPHSRLAAEIVHRRLLKATGLPDDGLWDGNLAVIRPTDFPAVLVETAYMIYPPEERLLRSEAFLKQIAEELARSVREFFEIQ